MVKVSDNKVQLASYQPCPYIERELRRLDLMDRVIRPGMYASPSTTMTKGSRE